MENTYGHLKSLYRPKFCIKLKVLGKREVENVFKGEKKGSRISTNTRQEIIRSKIELK